MISVIIPNYDGAKWLHRAIDSVIAQAVPNLEIIVVDDCSRDESLATLRAYGSKIKTIEFAENHGPNVARNIGLREASHPIVMFLDNDDYLAAGSLTAWYSELQGFRVNAVIGPMLYESEGQISSRISTPPRGVVAGLETAEAWIRDWVAPCCVLWEASILKSIGGWSSNANRTRDQDGEIVFRAALAGARFFWSARGAGVYVQHQSLARTSKLHAPINYEYHYLWLFELVRAAREKDDRFNRVFARYGLSLARECYIGGCVEQGRKFKSMVMSIAPDIAPEGSISHKVLVRCIGLRRKEVLSGLVRGAAAIGAQLKRTCGLAEKRELR